MSVLSAQILLLFVHWKGLYLDPEKCTLFAIRGSQSSHTRHPATIEMTYRLLISRNTEWRTNQIEFPGHEFRIPSSRLGAFSNFPMSVTLQQIEECGDIYLPTPNGRWDTDACAEKAKNTLDWEGNIVDQIDRVQLDASPDGVPMESKASERHLKIRRKPQFSRRKRSV